MVKKDWINQCRTGLVSHQHDAASGLESKFLVTGIKGGIPLLTPQVSAAARVFS